MHTNLINLWKKDEFCFSDLSTHLPKNLLTEAKHYFFNDYYYKAKNCHTLHLLLQIVLITLSK